MGTKNENESENQIKLRHNVVKWNECIYVRLHTKYIHTNGNALALIDGLDDTP